MVLEVPARHNDKLLQFKRKLKNSTLAPYVEVEARLEGETERRLVEVYKL